jgi:dTDP-4-dehydrorhamnose 3,5-epimerase
LKFTPQSIKDVILIEPNIISDDRGYFLETFRQDLLEEAIGYRINFLQDYQLSPYTQAKLVRVIEGSVLDVTVDIRKSSPTFGQHVSIELTAQNKHQLFVPRGFAHGFVVLSESATFAYKVDNYYSPKHDRGIVFDDESLKINWQLSAKELQLSDKVRANPSLANAKDLFV